MCGPVGVAVATEAADSPSMTSPVNSSLTVPRGFSDCICAPACAMGELLGWCREREGRVPKAAEQAARPSAASLRVNVERCVPERMIWCFRCRGPLANPALTWRRRRRVVRLRWLLSTQAGFK